ncbi:hypothetical protein, partial [uncultured Eubacterium sp.]|uniref:hypothetical protein n=1 Tax=uncultured Eubacterium sp. TaxID=165185 RepID=UPI002804A37F
FPSLSALSPRFTRCHVGENNPPDCFLPLRSLLVRIPCKKNKDGFHRLFFGGEQGIRTLGYL